MESSRESTASGGGRVGRRRLLGRLAIGVILAGVSAVLFKAKVGWFFPVVSGSMAPTVETGEWVFLRYDVDPLERFDIVAFTGVGGGASIKRVIGLPGEVISLDPTGDVRIEGAALRGEGRRPPLTPMFDSRLQSIDEHWRHGGAYADPWSQVDGPVGGPGEVWEMDGSAVARSASLGLLGFHDRVDDGALQADGSVRRGQQVVHDVAVSFEIKLLDAGGRICVQLMEQGDVFEVSVPVYEGEEMTRVDLFRRMAQPDPVEYFVYGRTAVPIGEWLPVRFSNIDNLLRFEIGEFELEFDYDYRGNTLHPTAFDMSAVSLGERVRLGGEGVVLQVRNIRVERDFHVSARGDFGAGAPLQLGPDEVFVVGDATGISRDSRERGPVSRSRIFARADAAVWPLRAARWLR
ncbi:S26 family signal peptidase [bacterium]|nr:S26 family signal peptidase [bacterium]